MLLINNRPGHSVAVVHSDIANVSPGYVASDCGGDIRCQHVHFFLFKRSKLDLLYSNMLQPCQLLYCCC